MGCSLGSQKQPCAPEATLADLSSRTDQVEQLTSSGHRQEEQMAALREELAGVQQELAAVQAVRDQLSSEVEEGHPGQDEHPFQ